MWDINKFQNLNHSKRKALLKRVIALSKKIKILNPLTEKLKKINLADGIYKNINIEDL